MFSRPDGVGGRMRPVSEFFGDLGENLGTDRIGETIEDTTRLGPSEPRYDPDRRTVVGESSPSDNILDSVEQLGGAGETIREIVPGATGMRAILGLVAALVVMVAAGQLFDVQVGGS